MLTVSLDVQPNGAVSRQRCLTLPGSDALLELGKIAFLHVLWTTMWQQGPFTAARRAVVITPSCSDIGTFNGYSSFLTAIFLQRACYPAWRRDTCVNVAGVIDSSHVVARLSVGSRRIWGPAEGYQTAHLLPAGRTCLHYAAGYGFEQALDVLLGREGIAVDAADKKGDTPLHLSAAQGHPMCAFNLTKAQPRGCLQANTAGQSPLDVAVACDRGEVGPSSPTSALHAAFWWHVSRLPMQAARLPSLKAAARRC